MGVPIKAGKGGEIGSWAWRPKSKSAQKVVRACFGFNRWAFCIGGRSSSATAAGGPEFKGWYGLVAGLAPYLKRKSSLKS